MYTVLRIESYDLDSDTRGGSRVLKEGVLILRTEYPRARTMCAHVCAPRRGGSGGPPPEIFGFYICCEVDSDTIWTFQQCLAVTI